MPMNREFKILLRSALHACTMTNVAIFYILPSCILSPLKNLYMLLHLLEWCYWFIHPTPRGRVAPEGGGRINRNTGTKGLIKC